MKVINSNKIKPRKKNQATVSHLEDVLHLGDPPDDLVVPGLGLLGAGLGLEVPGRTGHSRPLEDPAWLEAAVVVVAVVAAPAEG